MSHAHDRQLDNFLSEGCQYIEKNNTHPEKRPFHVETHLLVIKSHNPNQTLKRTDLHLRVSVLRRLAHDLHNVVALSLSIVKIEDRGKK